MANSKSPPPGIVLTCLLMLVGMPLTAPAVRAAEPTAEPSLVPDAPSSAPDYFCTWNVQGFVSSYADPNTQADAMTEANLFGKGPNQGWADFYPEARGDMLLVLDDTWDIPLGPRDGRGHPMRGSLELDGQRFPSYKGTPAERLAKLNADVRARGWRGVGLWVHSGRAKARTDPKVNEEDYWAQRMVWCKEAGIDYWKVDWGAMGDRDVWRLNQWARLADPDLWVEHGGGVKPTGERVWLADKLGVWRTYDVSPSAAVPETIRRVATALRYPRESRDSAGLINCEDEPYIGAALGCVYGVMRHPLLGNMPDGQPDRWFKPEFRDLKHRLDEVTRAVRWHRVAQPFAVTEHEAIDTILFKENSTQVGAPARVARGGLPLPTVAVRDGEDPPFVLCSRHPDGEVAIATAPRKGKEGEVIRPADVTLDVGELNRPVGIFGTYNSLTLLTRSPLTGKRILAQDLAGQTPVDITAQVKAGDGRLTIPGAVIRRVGLMAAAPGDASDPGMLLVVEGLTQFMPKSPMRPFPGGRLQAPAAEPGPLKIVRAVWDPVSGGEDVTARVAATIKDGALSVEAYPDTFGSNNPSTYQRLEVDYTCNGKGRIALALFGERLTIEKEGSYRTDRASRKEADPLDDPARAAHLAVSTYKEPHGNRTLTIRKADDLAQVLITAENGKRLLAVTGPCSVISETEFAVTGFNPFSDMEERIEVKAAADGAVELKRASLPFPETMSFLRAP